MAETHWAPTLLGGRTAACVSAIRAAMQYDTAEAAWNAWPSAADMIWVIARKDLPVRYVEMDPLMRQLAYVVGLDVKPHEEIQKLHDKYVKFLESPYCGYRRGAEAVLMYYELKNRAGAYSFQLKLHKAEFSHCESELAEGYLHLMADVCAYRAEHSLWFGRPELAAVRSLGATLYDTQRARPDLAPKLANLVREHIKWRDSWLEPREEEK